MSEQIFISYRRVGGDVTAKLICETLKRRGYTVFFDYDSIDNGRFDDRIFMAIENCTDFIVVLSKGALDNCINADDWVRWEIRHALKYEKNIIPIMVPEFTFPDNLPDDISEVCKFNGVKFVMDYFDGVMDSLTKRMHSRPEHADTKEEESVTPNVPKADEPKGFFASLFGIGKQAKKDTGSAPAPKPRPETDPSASRGLKLERFGDSYIVTGIGYCTDKYIVIPKIYEGLPVTCISKLNSTQGYSSIYSSSSSSSVKRIKISNSVVEIGQDAFYGFSALESVTVPSSVKKIGKGAFNTNTMHSIPEIVYDGTMEMWGKIRFAPDWITIRYSTTIVQCVDGVIELKPERKKYF